MAVSTDVFGEVDKAVFGLSVELAASLPRTADAGPVARVQQVIDAPDDSARLYALDNRGVIFVVENGEVLPEPMLDLRGRDDMRLSGDTFGGEYGLRSLAFHPDFADPDSAGYGRVYTSHSSPISSRPQGVEVFETSADVAPRFDSVVAEWRLRDPADPVSIDPTSKRELLRVEEPYLNHNLNQLTFDPNAEPGDPDYGLLFVGVGDGGSAYDPASAAQDLGSLAGKVLRVEPLVQADGAAYGVPDDNPFVGQSGAQPEIWAYGFRNPQTLSFDVAGNGRLFIGDIGQNRVEEVNVGLRGANYGWDVREGPIVIDDRTPARIVGNDEDGLQYPFSGYDHLTVSTNAGMAAGFVYRGDELTALQGQFVFADFPTGRLFAAPIDTLETALADGRLAPDEFVQPQEFLITVDGEQVPLADFMGNADGRVDARLATDEAGNLYVFGKQTGEIFKFVPVGSDDDETPASPPPDVALGYVGFDDAADLDLNGSAAIAGARLQLTANDTNRAGSAFHDQTLAIVANSSFSTSFAFDLDSGTDGADGFTFVLQNAPAGSGALGAPGGDLGLDGAVTDSLAIAFDTFRNNWDSPGANRLMVLADGEVRNPLAEQQVSAVDFNSGSVNHAWIEYDGTRGLLEVFLSPTSSKPGTAALSTTVDLAALVGSQAYAGFTAGTGGLYNSHQIVNWNLTVGDGGGGTNQPPALDEPATVTIAENTSVVVDLQASDDNDAEGSGLSYSLAGGADQALFSLDTTTGQLAFASPPDFEAPADTDGDNIYAVAVAVEDSVGFGAVESLLVTVENVAEPETVVQLVDENADYSSIIGWYDPSSGEAGIVSADTNAEEGATVVLKGRTPAETEFFLIPDGASNFGPGGRLEGTDPSTLDLRVVEIDGAFVVVTENGDALQGRVSDRSGLEDIAYFSEATRNPGDEPAALEREGGLLAWEDLPIGGDGDFNDLILSMQASADDVLI